MLILKILGWLWIALGIWWVLRPNSARKRFQKKFLGKLRLMLLLALWLIAGLLFAAGGKLGGVLGTVLIVAGAVALLKGFLFVNGAASARFVEWWGQQPTGVYRAVGVITLVLGILLQWADRWFGPGAG